jgi:hypothetical protein
MTADVWIRIGNDAANQRIGQNNGGDPGSVQADFIFAADKLFRDLGRDHAVHPDIVARFSP